MNAQAKQVSSALNPKMVLGAIQKAMMKAIESSPDYIMSEPFPVEISELFLYSPDGTKVLLVFNFLGNECVLSEKEIALEHNGKVLVLKDQLKMKALEFLVMRIKTLRELGF